MPRSHRVTETLGILEKYFPPKAAIWKACLFGCLRLSVVILAWLLSTSRGAQAPPQQATARSLSSSELVQAEALINQASSMKRSPCSTNLPAAGRPPLDSKLNWGK